MKEVYIIVNLVTCFLTIGLYRNRLNFHSKIISLISVLSILILVAKLLPVIGPLIALALNGLYMVYYGIKYTKNKFAMAAIVLSGLALFCSMASMLNGWPYISETKFAMLLPIIFITLSLFRGKLKSSELMILIILQALGHLALHCSEVK